MTVAELECTEKRMQQQWRNLVLAEQEGVSLEVLEQMYDTYILLLEEFNRCSEEYQRESSARTTKRKRITQPIASSKEIGHIRLAS